MCAVLFYFILVSSFNILDNRRRTFITKRAFSLNEERKKGKNLFIFDSVVSVHVGSSASTTSDLHHPHRQHYVSSEEEALHSQTSVEEET